MIGLEISEDTKEVPYLLNRFIIDYNGTLYNDEQQIIDLDEFNRITTLHVKDIAILLMVTFHSFNWPPVYWKHLIPLKSMANDASPENMVIGISEPVPSLEYPGYYMIPYFTNYVISKCGHVIKRSNGSYIESSKAHTNYYTFRLTGDNSKTSNQLRHRILAMTFLKYDVDFEDKDINHINGIPGSDNINNLEWCTRSENMEHAYEHGLRKDNVEVEAYDNVTRKHFIFSSCNQAARMFDISTWSVINSLKSNGYKGINGIQFRKHPTKGDFPEMKQYRPEFIITFEDGTTKQCSRNEAARHCGVTATSLARILREGRNSGTNGNLVEKIQSPTTQ